MFKILRPDYYYKEIYSIKFDLLGKNGIKGVICDIDNTIVKWSEKEMKKEVLSWFDELSTEGFKVCLVTNSLNERANYFSDKINIPAIGHAIKPAKWSYKKAQKIMDLSENEIVVIGDQIFTDILGGNRLGFMTILVDPLTEKEFFTTKFFRLLEKWCFTREKLV